MIRINNIKLNISYTENDLKNKINKLLKGFNYESYKLVKRSIDCRDKNDIKYIISVNIYTNDKHKEENFVKRVNNKNIMLTNEKNYQFPYKNISLNDEKMRPIIIGAGPAGYFAALNLAKAGFKPILIERGKEVEARSEDINNFWNTNQLEENSNVSFGEGGAGTFSDGKLNTGIKDKEGRIEYVLKKFYEYGASENILFDAKPHVGTDVLKTVMHNMRKEIQGLGGEIRFSSRLDDIKIDENSINKIVITNLTKNIQYELASNCVILAIGHSARDTFKMLYNNGLKMEQKPFAVGLRIEHKRHDIDVARYGEKAALKLPAADYKLTYHAKNGRAVFSFCMCPGGYVVNASSEKGCMVVNGMSYSGRDSNNSNSAIVCNVLPSDFDGESPMDAILYQKKLEEAFFNMCNGNVPIQTFLDFKNGIKSEQLGNITPCIKGKYSFGNLKESLPDYVSDAIIEGIEAFAKQIKDFNSDDAVLSGIESRTSSPVRIIRDNNMMSSKIGIIPCGEGAGYAGGITSAAVDGIKAAEACAAYLEGMRGKENI